MAKTRTVFVCQQCGNQQPRWLGRCPDCSAWDSFVEQTVSKGNGSKPLRTAASGRPESIIATLMRDADLLRRWRPGTVTLSEAVWELPLNGVVERSVEHG